MDRRSFLRTASAASLLPLMPALPVAAAPAAAPAVNEFMYGLAVFNARLRGASSTSNIARDLGIAKEAAQAMQARMVNEGLVGLPNSIGLSRAKSPFASAGNSWKMRAKAKLEESLKTRLKDGLKDALEQGSDTGPDASLEDHDEAPRNEA